MNVTVIILVTKDLSFELLLPEIISFMTYSLLTVKPWVKKTAKNVVIVITPRPPVCIRKRTISCPLRVKVSENGTDTRPVTQVAEVAVKRASVKPIPLYVEFGNNSRAVPMVIIDKKLTTKIRFGCTDFDNILTSAPDISMIDT